MSTSVSINDVRYITVANVASYERVSYNPLVPEGQYYKSYAVYENDTYQHASRDFIIDTGIAAGASNITVSDFHFGYNRVGRGSAWAVLPDFENKVANNTNIQDYLNSVADPSKITFRVLTNTDATVIDSRLVSDPNYVPPPWVYVNSGIDYEIFKFNALFDENVRNTVSYGIGDKWEQCYISYGVDNEWKKCKAYFGKDGAWQLVK